MASVVVEGESVEKLHRLKDELDANNHALESQVVELLRSSYPQLVQTAEGVHEMHSRSDAAVSRLSAACDRLPDVTRAIEDALGAAQSAIAQREQNAALLRHQAQLLELLEIPALMDTCIRSNLIDEALELRATAHALSAQVPDLPVLQRISEEVEHAAAVLHEKLLGALRGAASAADGSEMSHRAYGGGGGAGGGGVGFGAGFRLPEVLTTVGQLRRMGRLSDAKLRGEFLSGHTAALRSVLSATLRDRSLEPYRAALRVLEVARGRWFDALTQYDAIFGGSAGAGADADAGAAGSQGGAQGGALTVRGGARAGAAPAAPPLPAPAELELRSWLCARASELDRLLGSLLPAISELAFLANVLEQAMATAHSLGRVGADVHALLLPRFEGAVAAHFDAGLGMAGRYWGAALDSHVRAAIAAGGAADGAAGGAAAGGGGRNGGGGGGGGGAATTTALLPPAELLRWPPLAVLLNATLGALNGLRACALLELRPRLQRSLARCAAAAASELCARAADERTPPPASAALRALAAPMVEHLGPHLDQCFGALFGASSGAAAAAAAGARRAGAVTRTLRAALAPLTEAAAAAEAAAVAAAAPAAAAGSASAPELPLAGRGTAAEEAAPPPSAAPPSAARAAVGAGATDGGTAAAAAAAAGPGAAHGPGPAVGSATPVCASASAPALPRLPDGAAGPGGAAP